jgi:regulator of sigma E protease
MIVLYILYALIGISVIIFIHEAGHFLAAKRVGVRVERFAIGFDPPIHGRNLRLLCFVRGGTEYVLGAIPFGGYVKLAGGEMMLERDHAWAPDELPGKPVGARALVFVAGSVMNIASAIVFFMIAFTIGVPFPAPIVGRVEPGMPAWEAGLKPGDSVLAIDGEETVDFSELRIAVALGSPSRLMRLKVGRPEPDGQTRTLEMDVRPKWSAEFGYNVIGVDDTYSAKIGKVPEEGLAARSGLKEGDLLRGVEIAGTRVVSDQLLTLTNLLTPFSAGRPGRPFKLLVQRDGKDVWVDVAPQVDAKEKPRAQLGIMPAPGNVVRAVHAASSASAVFHAGDVVVAVEGEPFYPADWALSILERWPGKDGKLELTIASPGGEERRDRVDRDAFLRWVLNGEIHWGFNALTVARVETGSPLGASGLREGDVLLTVAGAPCFAIDDIGAAPFPAAGGPVTVEVRRGGTKVALQAERTDLLEGRGVSWRSTPPIGVVTTGGAADRAGITPGCVILGIAGKDIASWKDMVAAITSTQPGEAIEVAWRDPSGKEKSSLVAPSSQPVEFLDLPLTKVTKTIRGSPLESVHLGLKRTLTVAKQVFLTLRSLVLREVSAKNLQGPLGITHLLTTVAEQDSFSTLIYILALISVNLGLFNLLPFPILDGGHLLFLLVEKIKGSPVSAKVQEWAMNIAFFLIVGLALFVTFNDLKRLLN